MVAMGGDLVRVTKEQVGPASEMLVEAFFDDPKLTHVLPGEQERREHGRYLFAFELRYGLNYGRVFATSTNLEGVAVWLPSDRSEVTFWRAMRSGGMTLQKGIVEGRHETAPRLCGPGRCVSQKAFPGRHCYLFFIGVDPRFQGRGYGGS